MAIPFSAIWPMALLGQPARPDNADRRDKDLTTARGELTVTTSGTWVRSTTTGGTGCEEHGQARANVLACSLEEVHPTSADHGFVYRKNVERDSPRD